MNTHWLQHNAVQISHIITTVAIFGSALLYVTSMDKRIAVLEKHVISVEQRVDKQENYLQRGLDDVKQSVNRIDIKIDRWLLDQRD